MAIKSKVTLDRRLLGYRPYRLKAIVAWASVLGMVLTAISLGLTFVDVPKLSLFSGPTETIYTPDPDFTVKGLPTPTLPDLEFSNSTSSEFLKNYLQLRKSQDPEDWQAIETSYRQIFKREAQNDSLETVSHLKTIHGETCYFRERYQEAAKLLKEARVTWPDNPWAAIGLYRTYKALMKAYENTDEWTEADQATVRSLLKKIAELEKEFGRLSVLRMVALELLRGGEGPHGFFDSAVTAAFPEAGKLAQSPRGSTIRDLILSVPEPGVISLVWGTFRSEPAEPDTDLYGLSNLCANCTSPTEIARSFKISWRDVAVTEPAGASTLVAIGVADASPAGANQLQYAYNDVGNIARSLGALGFQTEVVTNRAATRKSILEHLARQVRRSSATDQLIVYYSGHGFTDVRGRSAVMASPRPVTCEADNDCDPGGTQSPNATGEGINFNGSSGKLPGNPAAVGRSAWPAASTGSSGVLRESVLQLSEINAVLSQHQGRVLVILDACLDARNIDLGDPPLHGDGGEEFEERTANTPIYLMAGGPEGIAIESKRLGGGVFTHVLDRYLQSMIPKSDQRMRMISDGGTTDVPTYDGTSVVFFDANATFEVLADETARLAMELHGVKQRPELVTDIP